MSSVTSAAVFVGLDYRQSLVNERKNLKLQIGATLRELWQKPPANAPTAGCGGCSIRCSRPASRPDSNCFFRTDLGKRRMADGEKTAARIGEGTLGTCMGLRSALDGAAFISIAPTHLGTRLTPLARIEDWALAVPLPNANLPLPGHELSKKKV